MSGSGRIDWGKWNRTMDGYYGQSVRPVYDKRVCRLPPTEKQIKFVEDIVKQLEDAGIEARWMIEQNRSWRLERGEINMMIKRLKAYRMEKLPNWGRGSVLYTNLVKNLRTGEKVQYKTVNRYARPKGFEFLGELSREFIPIADAEKYPIIVHYRKRG